MGKIKSLEVEDFKSYRGHQVIGPFAPFTAVIGPNGAGKSNLMDAISFVLGVQAKDLRGSKLKHLVAGATNVGGGSAKKAQVTVVYEDDTGREIRFSRSVSAATGASDYRIDGKIVTANDYIEALKAQHVLVKAKNFLVFQGDVESVAQKTPQELTKLFEHISGSEQLREPYQKAAQQTHALSEELSDLWKRKQGISSEYRELKRQKDEADEYKKMEDEVASTRIDADLFRLFYIEKDMESKAASIEGDRVNLEQAHNDCEELGIKITQGKADRAKRRRETAKIGKEVEKIEDNLGRIKQEAIQQAETVQHTQKRIHTTSGHLKKAEKNHKEHAESIKLLEAELQQQLKLQSDLEEEEKKRQQEAADQRDPELTQQYLEEYVHLKERANRVTSSAQQAVHRLGRQESSLNDKIRRLKMHQDDLHHNMKNVEEVVSEKQAQLSTLKEQHSELKKQHTEMSAEKNELVTAANEAQTEATRIRNELDDIKAQLREARSNMNESAKQKKINEAIVHLQKTHRGVYGKVVNLCKPRHERYQLPLSVVMGRNADAVVVDTEETAIKCLKYIKQERIGIVTFLPLDGLRVRDPNPKLRSLGGTSKLLLDVLNYESKYEPAFIYACGDTVICDQLAEARKIAYGKERHKVVTLNGTLILKNGFIAGGKGGEASRDRWTEQNVQELRKRSDDLQQQLAVVERNRRNGDEIARLAGEIGQIQGRLDGLEREINNLESTVAGRAKELELNKKQVKRFEHEQKELTTEVTRVSKELGKKKQELNNAEDTVFSDFCKKVGVENIRAYEASDVQEAQKRQQRRLQNTEAISKLQSQIENDRARNTEADIKKFRKHLEKLNNALKKETTKLEVLRKDTTSLERKLEEVEDHRRAAAKREGELDDELHKVHNELKKKRSEERTVRDRMTALFTIMEQLMEQRHSLLRTCADNGIQLPMLEGSFEYVAMASEYRRASEDSAENPHDTRRHSAEHDPHMIAHVSKLPYQSELAIKLDFTRLEDKLKELETVEELQEVQKQYEDRISSLTTKLSQLMPNMRAGERLEEARERLDAAEQEHQRARVAHTEAQQEFERIKLERKELFMSAFNHVRERIDGIYKEMTRTQRHNLGGQAYLTLENVEDPYDYGIKYNAMPPMKRFRDMDQLSGGEKTVAALALLFAIHSFQPSPFFVLDEVDAALDNVNVVKIAEYIKSRSDDFQSIVISLKDNFYYNADMIVGIYKDQAEQCSHTVSMDLRRYDRAPVLPREMPQH
eukprot:Clim_evm87s25 gene=Clim_evmTU87s25